MAGTSVIDTVAKYFYFSSLDEQISFAASLKALAEIKNGGWLDTRHQSKWIEILSRAKPRLRYLRGRPWPGFTNETGFTLPKDFDLAAWSQFLTNGEPSEIEAVLLSRILHFSDRAIADGLKVTTGTVRYRVGRGLRHLGGYLES